MAQEARNREQDETGCRQPAGLVLCANNCGFFGREATMNLCSKCYRDLVLKKADGFSPTTTGERSMVSALGGKALLSLTVEGKLNIPAVKRNPPMLAVQHEQVQIFAPAEGSSGGGFGQAGSLSAAISDQQKQQILRTLNRCLICRKRVGLTGFKCRCGDLFCALHRYSDKHNCSFDYKAQARDAIAKENPVIKPDKVQKI